MSNKQYSFGLNTRNISTSNRTSAAVTIGSLRANNMGSTTRIYKWCSRQCPADPIACVFQQVTPAVSKSSWSNIDILQLDLGIACGNVGLGGQIILGGSNGGTLRFSSDLGNTWGSYPGSTSLPGGISGIGWSSVVMSDDTKFVIGTPYVVTSASDVNFDTYNGIWYRRDSAGWFLLQSCPLSGGGTLNFNNNSAKQNALLFIDAGISQDGQYMAALTTPRFDSNGLVYLIYSNNYGETWIAYSLDPYTTPYNVTTNSSSISIANITGTDNDLFLITSKLEFNPTLSLYQNGTCCVSNNSGSTFTVPSGISGNDFVYSSMSDNGQYQVFVTATNPQDGNTSIPSRLYLSSNSGTTFSQIIELPLNGINFAYFGGVSMSSDGKYITASVLNASGGFQYIYVSSDTGVTWKKIYNDSNGTTFNSIATDFLGFLNTNYSGQYQILTGTNQLFVNNNYGN